MQMDIVSTQLNLFLKVCRNTILTETIKFVFTPGTFTYTVPHSRLWNNTVIVPTSIHQLMDRRCRKLHGCCRGIKLFLCRCTKHFLWSSTKRFLWRSTERFLWRSTERFLWGSTERYLWRRTKRCLWRRTKRYLWRRTSWKYKLLLYISKKLVYFNKKSLKIPKRWWKRVNWRTDNTMANGKGTIRQTIRWPMGKGQ